MCGAIDDRSWAIVERLSALIPVALCNTGLCCRCELQTSPCALVVAHAVNSERPCRCIDLCRDVKRDGLSWVIGHFIAVRLYLRCGRLRVDDPCRCAGILVFSIAQTRKNAEFIRADIITCALRSRIPIKISRWRVRTHGCIQTRTSSTQMIISRAIGLIIHEE